MKKVRKILITAGPTREHMDPVRFITNLSTGEMGYALARVAVARGYRVSLVSGPTALSKPAGVRFFPVVSTAQMKKTCAKLFSAHDCLMMTAAVSDFRPVHVRRQKIPSGEGITLRLERTPDILASLARRKGKRIVIGFCLETKDLVRRAKAKVKKKKLDGIVANFYDAGRQVPFGKRKIVAVRIDSSMRVFRESPKSKDALARKILAWMSDMAARR